MQVNKFILSATILLTLLSLSIASYLLVNDKKIGYVDAIRLFNEYKMKQELEDMDVVKLNVVKEKLDSLKAKYSAVTKESKADKSVLGEIESQVQYWNHTFEQEYERSNRDINEKVWKRLNPTIDEFSKKEKLDILMGANGMGTVLYGSKGTDYTDKLIKYVNDKYASGEQ